MKRDMIDAIITGLFLIALLEGLLLLVWGVPLLSTWLSRYVPLV